MFYLWFTACSMIVSQNLHAIYEAYIFYNCSVTFWSCSFVVCPHRLSENNFCYCSYFILAGHTPRTISSSPSTESLSGGRDHAMSSPPLPVSRGRDSSTSSPPSATKKDSFFNISRSRSHSKTINKKDAVSSEFSFCNSCFLFYNFTICSPGLSFCGNFFFILHANYYYVLLSTILCSCLCCIL